jgi:hypothetical protein
MHTTNLPHLDRQVDRVVMGRCSDSASGCSGPAAPKYSTWQAVGEVVEHMNELGYVLFCYSSLDRSSYRAQFHDISDGSGWGAQGISFAIAVCLAALAVFDGFEENVETQDTARD